MDDFILARVLHVLAIIAWIGGVAFVTTVLMPAIRAANPPGERLAAFHHVEQGFARQVRFWVALAGLSGFWMAYRADMWDRFADPHYWWMHAMVGLWLVFAVMLYLVEPLFLHRRMEHSADPARDFAKMQRMHRVMLGLATITVLGAVAGSHGLI